VAWIGTREGNKDRGELQFGGNVVFRELIQHADGSLETQFPAEMIPAAKERLAGINPIPLTPGATCAGRVVKLESSQGLAAAAYTGLLANTFLSLQVYPQPGTARFGLRLKAMEAFDSGYDLSFSPHEGMARLNDQWITAVERLDQPFSLEVAMHADIIDVCIDHRRTIIDRCPERHGERLIFYALNGGVRFELTRRVRIRLLAVFRMVC